ncbi:carboxymuconolactone decarboxylase family protein [Novosphingobium beihaiensis]|uniref:Carboxymuconolactone decarboxylase family protein n=1 Tax=Novosphingobium beihaiensis TaxID=2930389 RepID=A0ABT0BQN7_9SPHN|nr:carboxymuconolactone decarboxylase family protein [Novosphingobium beihaiensis]MCJ2187173.1 carboxymuconolactone decarboxylase family protein [Novosphingobium beihaiensis]
MGTGTVAADFDPGFDIAARQAHVVGDGPRIRPVAQDDIDAASRELVHAVRDGAGAPRVEGVAEYMRTIFKHPALFRCQMERGAVLFNGRIPACERELAVLRVAWLCRAPYEWGQHVEIARRVGLDGAAVERVREGSAASGWTAHEAAILRGVEELLEDKALSDATWDVLARSWDEAQLIEFPVMVGEYIATALVQNTLRIRLVDGNPGLTRI